MAISVRNAFAAGASDSIDELRETIASLEAQVTSLYEEREADGTAAAGGDTDGLLALYEQKVWAGRVTINDLQTAVHSFEQQLACLYEESETAGDSTNEALHESLHSLEAQISSMYADREDDGDLHATLHGLNEQLTALYVERQEQADLPMIVEGLEAQLAALYGEREDAGEHYGHAGGSDVAALSAMVRSFEEQLAALYEEQAASTYGITEANEMVMSLEPQVAALLEERDELAKALAQKQAELDRSRIKAKAMVASLMESALA